MANAEKNKRFLGVSGDDLVTAVVNERLELVQIDFTDFDYNTDEAYILEELIVVAVNNALADAKRALILESVAEKGKD